MPQSTIDDSTKNIHTLDTSLLPRSSTSFRQALRDLAYATGWEPYDLHYIYNAFPELHVSFIYTDPPQHPRTTDTGSTVDDLYDLSDLDRRLSKVRKTIIESITQ